MSRRSRPIPVALAGLLGVVLCLLTLVGIGGAIDPVEGLAWVMTTTVYAGGPAAVYLLSALGWGQLCTARLVPGQQAGCVRAAVGLAILLTLSHALGTLGLLNTASARGVCAIGLAAIVARLWANARVLLRSGLHAGPGWVSIPAVCVLFIAASCPPGTVWGSEFGGYDALSYHLQLPQEWLAAGRLEPLQHNVYSFLPGYIESAYLHIGALIGAPTAPGAPGQAYGLLAGDGWGVLSCQWLHAGLAVYAAWIVGGLTRLMAARAGLEGLGLRLVGSIAAGLTLATPWVVVVGSLAYNEMAVVALGAGALAAALLDGGRPWVRGAIVGALVGVACGAKPTAMLMIAPVAGLMLLWAAPRRAWIGVLAAAAFCGALALLPWMIRNTLHGGNPVFPYAVGLFGSAHWNEQQVARFASGHHFKGSLLDRLQTALWINPASAPGDRAVERFRGLSNPQWGVFFYAAGLSIVAAVWWHRRAEVAARRTAAAMLMLALGLGVQLMAWLTLTHIQSRFLLPCVATGAPLIALACVSIRRRAVGAIAAVALTALQTGVTVWVWSQQLGGAPTGAMIAGVRMLKGEPFIPELHADMPTPATSHIAGKDRVYLLGGSTPLYFLCPVLYHTTWDTSPLGELMAARPGEPWTWAGSLRDRGVVYVLADYAELNRLTRSGWYDSLVTPQTVRDWLDEVAEPLVGWSDYGQVLYRLKEKP